MLVSSLNFCSYVKVEFSVVDLLPILAAALAAGHEKAYRAVGRVSLSDEPYALACKDLPCSLKT
jgi:hypothetical protein